MVVLSRIQYFLSFIVSNIRTIPGFFLYEGSMKTVIGIKVSPELKKILQEAAKDENRSLSNFIKHCLLTYLKEKKSIEYKED